MRAILVLLLVSAAFFLVVEFYPSTPVEGAGPAEALEAARPADAAVAAEERGFLDPTSRSVPGPAAREVPVPETEPREWLASVEPAAEVVEGEIALGAALLHGSPADVARAVDASAVDGDRALMARSCAAALAGQVGEGLALAGRLDETRLGALERGLLEEVLGGRPSAAGVSPSDWSEGPLVRAMGMAVAARRAERLAAELESARAARLLSDLIMGELTAPWPANRERLGEWSELLDDVQARHRWHPRGAWPAVEMTVRSGDSLISVRKRYLAAYPGRLMCAGLIQRANALSGYLQPGQVLRVPTDQASVLIDLSSRWALYLLGNEVAGSWPVGIGRAGQETRTGLFTAGNKLENPPWMKVGQRMIPYGDPENPLGTRWIGWYEEGVKTSFGFHGTWEPDSVGHASSDGCVRFLNEHVEVLFEILPDGATIRVRD